MGSSTPASSMIRFALLLAIAAVAAAQIMNQPPPITLTMQPGCDQQSNSTDLTPGITGACQAVVDELLPNDQRFIVWTVPQGAQMSLSVSMRAKGGVADMALYFPGTPLSAAPDRAGLTLYRYASELEAWVFAEPQTLADHPGEYILHVSGVSGSPRLTFDFYTPGPNNTMAAQDVEALQALYGTCCSGVAPDKSTFCGTIAPRALADGHAWADDLCHIPPNRCDDAGRLQQLVLLGMGLQCSGFPASIGNLTQLQRLDLSSNDLGGATFHDMAVVLKTTDQLTELSLANTGLSGPLECLSKVANRTRLDLSSNALSGPLKACLMASPFQEVFLGNNELTGGIPVLPAEVPSAVRVLYAPAQRGVGLVGPIPGSLLASPALEELDLGANNLTGTIPPLGATNLTYLNVSRNGLTGVLPAELPPRLWGADFSHNAFQGGLPPLQGLRQLAALILSYNLLTGPVPALPGELQQLELAANALSGPLPELPAGMIRLDVANNLLEGDVSSIDFSSFQDFRAANNSLSGSVPDSAAKAPHLFMLSLRKNKISGSLPDVWQSASLKYLLLQDNRITGTLPASLAALPELGVLRLQKNAIGGTLKDFADVLPPDNRLFDVNVSHNQLSGPVPDSLGKLAVFNASTVILLNQGDGTASQAARLMDLSANQLEGDWPLWLLRAVPATRMGCACAVVAALNGPEMRLRCPAAGAVSVPENYAIVAAAAGYTCWDGQAAALLWDLLARAAPGNGSADAGDGGGGGGGPAAPWSRKPGGGLSPGAAAGVACAVLGAAGAAAAAGLLLRRRVASRRAAGDFARYVDDEGGAAAVAAARERRRDDILRHEAAAMGLGTTTMGPGGGGGGAPKPR